MRECIKTNCKYRETPVLLVCHYGDGKCFYHPLIKIGELTDKIELPINFMVTDYGKATSKPVKESIMFTRNGNYKYYGGYNRIVYVSKKFQKDVIVLGV